MLRPKCMTIVKFFVSIFNRYLYAVKALDATYPHGSIDFFIVIWEYYPAFLLHQCRFV